MVASNFFLNSGLRPGICENRGGSAPKGESGTKRREQRAKREGTENKSNRKEFTLAETVVETLVDELQMPHSASSSGLPSNGLLAPLVLRIKLEGARDSSVAWYMNTTKRLEGA